MRRACSAVLAGTLLTAAALPAALLTGESRASASTAQAATVTISITGISPQTAALTKTMTIKGTVSNHSRQPLVNAKVRFLVGQVAIGDMKTFMADEEAPGPVGTVPVAARATQPAPQIPPGASSSWSITFPASRLGFSTFGAYPITAQISESGTALASTNSFLPYTPPKHGRYSGRAPRPQQIAWVLPLIDQPFIEVPGSQQCQSAQAAALAASLAGAGRLNGLLEAGTTRFAYGDNVTWAVDPALLRDVGELRDRCEALTPGRSAAAKAWLSKLLARTADQPLFTTPYANISLALVSESRTPDVQNALLGGRTVAQPYVHQHLTPKPPGTDASTQARTSGTLWPPDGVGSLSTIEAFVRSDFNLSTVLLSSAMEPSAAPTASRVVNGGGGSINMLLYNSELSQLLAKAPAAPSERFGIDQAFLAATAVLAGQPSSQPILAVPPQLWHASGRLVADLLAETAHTSWLQPVSLAMVANGARSDRFSLPKTAMPRPGFSPAVIHRLKELSHDINQLSSLHAYRNQDLQFALYALESASRRLSRPRLLSLIMTLDDAVNFQLKQVGLDLKGPVFLGGLKGNVPLIINNPLPYAVRVRVVASVTQPQGGGFTVQEATRGLIVVPPRTKYPMSLHVQATQAGAATIFLHLVNDRNQTLPGQVASVTVHATQFGTLAMIILASALGVFTIASAARGLRRRPSAPDNPAEGGHPDPDNSQGGEITAEPDTVVREHSELGATGPSGL